jgi:predicted RNA-binding Zn ribbon-like protein
MPGEEHPFVLDSGSLALDLVNTLRIEDGERVEELPHAVALRAWLRATGLARDPAFAVLGRSPPHARTLLDETRRVRGDVRDAVEALGRGGSVPGHVLYGINRVLGASRVCKHLRVEDGSASLEEVELADASLALLSPVARAAAELLTEHDPSRIRRCAAEGCDRWFVDTSRGGRRRWCSMATCGNRAKATRYRRRVARG